MKPFADPVWSEGIKPFRPAPPRPDPGRTYDLLVIGAGFQGLSAALHAARQGASVLVLEAGALGTHASGLNGGQVIPGLKYDPEWLMTHFGDRQGKKLVRFAAGTADAVFDLIDRENLAVPHRRSGWIQACHTEKALDAARNRHRQWAAAGADVALLDQAGISSAIGTNNYIGGFLDRRAGTINPLAFQFELARLSVEAGALILENHQCDSLRRANSLWHARTDKGADFSARRVLVATNAYSETLIPGLNQSIVALHSFQIATAPLSGAGADAILPGGQAVSDSRRILVYYRKTEQNRLILGGRGPMRLSRSPRDWAHLERALHRLFPMLKGKPIEKRWFGRVCVTPDHLPHIHEPEPGLMTMVGCQGRGVGLMTAAGPRLADYLLHGDPDVLPLPISPIQPIPFHPFRRIGVGAVISWYRLHDALEK